MCLRVAAKSRPCHGLSRRSHGVPNSSIFLCFFNGFAFLGLPGAILAQHGLQDTSENLPDASKSRQDAPANAVCTHTWQAIKSPSNPQIFRGVKIKSPELFCGRRSLRLGPSWGVLAQSWGHLGGVLGRLGVVLGWSWGVLGASWRHLGASGGRPGGGLRASWAVL